jgi:hypothetical protein
MLLEKAGALRAEADRLEAEETGTPGVSGTSRPTR